jgi:hypothetical protein
MLEHENGHGKIGREAPEHLLNCVQSTGGSHDPDETNLCA